MKNKFLLFLVVMATSVKSYALPKITTSITPVASLVSMLTKGHAEISVINIESGCPHEYQMRPSDKAKIVGSDLLIYIDDQFDAYASSFAPIMGDKMIRISSFESINFKNENGINNWHFWLDLDNVLALHEELSKIIKEKIPSLSEIIDDNMNKARLEIESLKLFKKHELESIGEVVVLSDSVDHFIRNLDGSIIRLYQKQNSSLQDLDNLEYVLNTDQPQCIILDKLQDPTKYKKFNKKIIQLDSENWKLSGDMSNSYSLFCTKYLKMINQLKSCR